MGLIVLAFAVLSAREIRQERRHAAMLPAAAQAMPGGQ